MRDLYSGFNYSAKRLAAGVGISEDDLQFLLRQEDLFNAGVDLWRIDGDDLSLTAAGVYRVLSCLLDPPVSFNFKQCALQSAPARRCAQVKRIRNSGPYF